VKIKNLEKKEKSLVLLEMFGGFENPQWRAVCQTCYGMHVF
jgi:hypothetical protein